MLWLSLQYIIISQMYCYSLLLCKAYEHKDYEEYTKFRLFWAVVWTV